MTEEIRKKIEELEKELKYVIKPTMTLDEKIAEMKSSYFHAHNSGYNEAMANRLMGGREDEQTERWERDCKFKWEVETLLNLLTEYKDELRERL